jgi:hypothetical protein
MTGKVLAFSLLTVSIIFLTAQPELKAQLPDYQKLEAQAGAGSTGMALIIGHLERSGTDQPLEELIRWARTGFPEYYDEHRYWRGDFSGFHSNFEQAIFYFMNEYDGPDKGAKYLRVVEDLKKYGHFTHQLTQNAYRFLTDEELETEFYRLVKLRDPEERSRGFVMGRVLAEKNERIAAVYFKAAKEDRGLHPRYSAIVIIAMTHSTYPREIALAGLDRLLNDPEKLVRDFGGVLVRQSADFRSTWTEQDISMLLAEMLKSRDPVARKTLAMTVGKLTTENKSLYIDEEKWKDDPQEKFIALVNTSENELKKGIEGEDLVDAWKAWWTPLIEKYMVKHEVIACGKG